MGGDEGICWWYVDTPVRMERRNGPYWWFAEGSLMVRRKVDDSGEENEAGEGARSWSQRQRGL